MDAFKGVMEYQPSLNTTATSTSAQTSSNATQVYQYYHAGPLFTLGDLHTNVLLSTQIHGLSSGKFVPILPQDLEQRDTTPHSIRDQDIRSLLAADLCLITYDGTELDAGTVVEYMVAKTADIPCVILRTDFRGGGDQGVYMSEEGHGGGTSAPTLTKGDPWNLMSSFWPRTKTVVIDGMMGYKGGLAKALAEQSKQGSNAGGKSTSQVAGELLLDSTAKKVIDAMEEVLRMPARLPQDLRQSVYTWLALMVGFKKRTDITSDGDNVNVKEMLSLLESKETKGLFR